MSHKHSRTFVCAVCGQTKPVTAGTPAELVYGPIADLIKKQHIDWDSGHTICLSCLSKFRSEYFEDVLEEQRGDLSSVEDAVIKSLKEHDVLARDVNTQFDRRLTPGERLADKMAEFGGSWRFLGIFSGILLFWIALNTFVLVARPFDPYPFILLNLVLSCLAAVQAPIIMMSQNRQEDRDRLRAENDYQVNLKAEIEIRQLHIKLDQLLYHSWNRLLEIQMLQTDMMESIARRAGKK
jgi:uncharacterized membrane protein